MTSTTSCDDWRDFISLKYHKYIGDEIADMWSWLGETSGLPHMYTIRRINTKYCKFNPKIRYQKMFCGYKFKIGGHKE